MPSFRQVLCAVAALSAITSSSIAQRALTVEEMNGLRERFQGERLDRARPSGGADQYEFLEEVMGSAWLVLQLFKPDSFDLSLDYSACAAPVVQYSESIALTRIPNRLSEPVNRPAATERLLHEIVLHQAMREIAVLSDEMYGDDDCSESCEHNRDAIARLSEFLFHQTYNVRLRERWSRPPRANVDCVEVRARAEALVSGVAFGSP